MFGEWIIELNSTNSTATKEILGFAHPLNPGDNRKLHKQCCSQIVTKHKGRVAGNHINFIKCCVFVGIPHPDPNKTKPLLVHILDSRVPDAEIKYEKLEKILRKHFYADQEFCSMVPKVMYEVPEEFADYDLDESIVDHEDASADDKKEKWDLQYIFTNEEITCTDPAPVMCMTEGCLLRACVRYVQDIDQTTEIWHSCLDCQEKVRF